MPRYGRDFDDRFHDRYQGGFSGSDGWNRGGQPDLGGYFIYEEEVFPPTYGGRSDWSRGSYDREFGGSSERGWDWGGWGRLQEEDRLHSSADIVRAGEIMTPNPATVRPDTPLAAVARLMRDRDVGVVPVVEEGNGRLHGVITDRDIAVRAAAEGKDMNSATAGEFMTRDVESVHAADTVRDVFSVMKRERVRRVPVTDEGGRLVGIIAQADLAVDYAGVDLEREIEVEEVIERISEPGGPPREWYGRGRPGHARRGPAGRGRGEYDMDLGDRVRSGWRTLRRGARHLLGREYDRGWR